MTDSRENNAFVFAPLELTDDQAYALFTDDDAGVLADPFSVLTAAVNPVHTGAMVALVPSQADLERLAMEGGEPLEELHLTLAYLGEAADISEEMRAKIIQTCMRYFTQPITTSAFSVNVFNPHDPGVSTAIVLGIKGEDLEGPRGNVMSAVRGMYSGMPENHRPWIPHVTLQYADPRRVDLAKYQERLGDVTFDTLRFAFGGEVTDIPLAPLTAAVNRMPRQLKRYWLGPEGSARVGGWGNEGSFRACQAAMREEGVDADQIDGLCANLYREATGRHPGRKKEEHSLDVLLASMTEPLEEEAPGGDAFPTLAAWDGVLTVEGIESGDGRMFKFGSLDWASLPLPLMYQPANTGGHSGSIMVGQINNVYRDGNKVFGQGVIDLAARTSDGFEVGREVYRLMSEAFLTGVSVDVDKVKDADVEQIYSSLEPKPFDKPTMTVFNRGRVRGATLVAFPAFDEARIQLTGDVLTASAGELILTHVNFDEIITAATHIIEIPDVPPAWWFNHPTDVEMKGALTITDEGRVYGRLAPAGVTHRSVNKKVPRNVDYSRFQKGETIVAGADGSTGRVKTGVITFNCGHASADPQVYGTLENRIDHYDNSCSVFADITIGEDENGTWVAGAVKPFATAEQIQRAMSCTLSGDWQPHRDKPGVTDFVAALLVPVPGFAMARREASVQLEEGAMVASSVPLEFSPSALTAAVARKEAIRDRRLGKLASQRKLELAKKIGRSNDV